jgi:hypothetical protein
MIPAVTLQRFEREGSRGVYDFEVLIDGRLCAYLMHSLVAFHLHDIDNRPVTNSNGRPLIVPFAGSFDGTCQAFPNQEVAFATIYDQIDCGRIGR